MYYIIYLLGIVFYFVKGIGIHKIFPGFIDYVTLVFILFPCFFILFCTKSFKSFGRAFLFAFGKRDASLTQYRESLAYCCCFRNSMLYDRNDKQRDFLQPLIL